MKKRKLEIDEILYLKAVDQAKVQGYTSVEEWVEHLLERSLVQVSPAQNALAEQQLKGLGYL